MSITSISQSVTGNQFASTASSQLANDYESFITLLVAQVQNQDPMAPMDSTQFVSQLAQLTQVEQSVRTNSQMESLRQQLAMSDAFSMTSMLGREVTAQSDQISLTEQGTEFWYKLDSDAALVSAQIVDETGQAIKTFDTLPVTGGDLHHITWDGLSEYGFQTLPGSYRLQLNAVDGDGVTATYSSYTKASVVSVDYAQGESRLQLEDGRIVASGEIIAAR